jgi:hypothetical protein
MKEGVADAKTIFLKKYLSPSKKYHCPAEILEWYKV